MTQEQIFVSPMQINAHTSIRILVLLLSNQGHYQLGRKLFNSYIFFFYYIYPCESEARV